MGLFSKPKGPSERKVRQRTEKAQEKERLRQIEEVRKLYSRETKILEDQVSAGPDVSFGSDQDALERSAGGITGQGKQTEFEPEAVEEVTELQFGDEGFDYSDVNWREYFQNTSDFNFRGF
jgi:hypothetical protein